MLKGLEREGKVRPQRHIWITPAVRHYKAGNGPGMAVCPEGTVESCVSVAHANHFVDDTGETHWRSSPSQPPIFFGAGPAAARSGRRLRPATAPLTRRRRLPQGRSGGASCSTRLRCRCSGKRSRTSRWWTSTPSRCAAARAGRCCAGPDAQRCSEAPGRGVGAGGAAERLLHRRGALGLQRQGVGKPELGAVPGERAPLAFRVARPVGR